MNRKERERGALPPGSLGAPAPGAIREVTEADRATVIGLWHAAGNTRPWNDPDADFSRALASGASTMLLTADGQGTVMVGDDGHRGWIYYLAVHPDAQGKGLGRALMDAAEGWLRARGCPKIQLMVRDGNPATGFYEAIGMEQVAVVTYGRFLT